MKKIFLVSVLLGSSFSVLANESDDAPYANVKVGGEYNYWKPMGLRGLNVKTKGYQTGFVEVSLNSEKLGVPYLPSIPKLRYETNFSGSSQNEVVEPNKKGSGYEYFLAKLNYKSFYFQYESESFISDVSTENEVFYFTQDGGGYNLTPGETYSYATSFDSFSLLYEKEGTNAQIGLYFSEYQKPYFISSGSEQLSEYLFYANFKSWGLHVEGMKLDDVFPSLDFMTDIPIHIRLGTGDVELVSDLELEEALDNGMELYYFELGLNKEINFNLSSSVPAKIDLSLNWKSFHFEDSFADNTIGTDANNDVLVTVAFSVLFDI